MSKNQKNPDRKSATWALRLVNRLVSKDSVYYTPGLDSTES